MAHPDPSSSVPQDLMPHVHLISSHRYPSMPRLEISDAAKHLMMAPQISRDRAPFFWTFLDRPSDSTTLLTWQPLQRLGNSFASDGYVWAPPEQVYRHDLGNGLIMEIYYLKAGYIPGETHALHARKRFRLVPAPGHPNPPQVDMSLFIVHYEPAELNDRIPINMIPHDERVQQLMNHRHLLMRQGQIQRKEFMLSDRVNWPSLPQLRQPMGPGGAPRGVPQQMAYPPQVAPGPPSKRARHSQGPQGQPVVPGMPAVDGPLDDDEDTSRGDLFDHLTPREISLSRYQQNHEWMEEILSSPYRINQITPPDLGLGLKGELASLTEGVFAAQGGDALNHYPEKTYVGRLDPGQAEEFRTRVQAHIESTKSEIEKMQAEHAKALGEFRQTSLLGKKEKELRSLTEGSGTEAWRMEGRIDPEADDSGKSSTSRKTIDEVAAEVEEAVGRTIVATPSSKRVQDGGYQPPAPEPVAIPQQTEMSRQPSHAGSQASGVMVGESDIEMGNTAAGLLDQMGTGFSSMSTPVNNFPTPQAQFSAAQSNAPTPSANISAASPATGTQHAPQTQNIDANNASTNATAPDQGTGSGDWVVVPKDGATPDPNAQAPAPKSGPTSVKGPSAAGTPAFDQNDFSSLGDLDTAGDALSGYDTAALDGAGGDLGEGLDLNMDVEDSAFGDAFHGLSQTGTPGEGQGQDM